MITCFRCQQIGDFDHFLHAFISPEELHFTIPLFKFLAASVKIAVPQKMCNFSSCKMQLVITVLQDPSISQNIPNVTALLQEADFSEDEGPVNEAYDEAGVLTAHLSQLLDLRLVAGPKTSLDSEVSHGSLPPSRSNTSLQLNGSQQQHVPNPVRSVEELLQGEPFQGAGLLAKADEEKIAREATPSAKRVSPALQQHASQNGVTPGEKSSIHIALQHSYQLYLHVAYGI